MLVRHLLISLALFAALPASAESGTRARQLAQDDDDKPGWYMMFQRENGEVFGQGKGPYRSEQECRNDPFFKTRGAEASKAKLSITCKYYEKMPY